MDHIKEEKLYHIEQYTKDLFESCEHKEQLKEWERKVKAIVEYYAATRF